MKLPDFFSAKVLPGANSREDPGGGERNHPIEIRKIIFSPKHQTIRVPKNPEHLPGCGHYLE